MREVSYTVFTFEELTDAAKARAVDSYRARGVEWHWQSEWWDSAQAFSKIAPVDIKEAYYDRRHVNAPWLDDWDVGNLAGSRAWKWLQNNGWFDLARANARGDCTLTGYCGDCPLFDPIAAYEKTPLKIPTLRQVFYECAQSWVNAAADDLEWHYSDECIADHLHANEYEFLQAGEMY
jgi:hypothetical protein